MWPRTQLKIDWHDLAFGLSRSLSRVPANERTALARRIEEFWSPDGKALVCFSVRSGFDLTLQAMALPPGSEILFSALNIKGMVKVVERLGFKPVPVDLDLALMAPRLDLVERAITPNTRAIVVAHLFGTRLDLDPLIALARRRGIAVIEDCAQAFDGRRYAGAESADVSMFSFGPLKTATALGGAILRVRDDALLERMRAIQAAYPVQEETAYRKRLLKFAGLKVITSPVVFGMLFRTFQALGKDYEDPVSEAVRNVAKLGSSGKLRKQCSATLLAVLDRRLLQWREGSLDEQARMGARLRDLLAGAVACPASGSPVHNYWVFPILTDDPSNLIRSLRAAGFDGANLPRSQAISAPLERPELEPATAQDVLTRLVVLPCYPGMSETDLERQAEIVRNEAVRDRRPALAAAA